MGCDPKVSWSRVSVICMARVVCKFVHLGYTISAFFCFSRTIETHNRHKKDKLYKFFNVIQSEPEGPLYEGHVKG